MQTTSSVKSLLLALVLCGVCASPAFAQVHPCDLPAATAPVEVEEGAAVGAGFCFDYKTETGKPSTLDGFKVLLDNVLQPNPGPLVKSATANAAGFFYFETPRTIVAPKGTHAITILLANAEGGDGKPSVPFSFVVKVLPPGTPVKPRVVK